MEHKTTDIDRMLKSFENASSNEERFDLAAKYWNELALGYNLEHEYVSKENGVYVEEIDKNSKYKSIDDFFKKAAESQKRLEEIEDYNYRSLSQEEKKEYEDFVKYIRCLVPYITDKDYRKYALDVIRTFGYRKPTRIKNIKWEMDWDNQLKGIRSDIWPMWDIYDPKNHIIPEPESINKSVDVRAKLINLIGEMTGYSESHSLYWTALQTVKQELNTILLGDILRSKK